MRRRSPRWKRREPPLLLSPFVLAELDYLLAKHVGPHAQGVLLDEVARQAYQLEPFDSEDVGEARRVMDRYGDLSIGLADASLVVLANRYDVTDLLTLDERHFRAIRGPRGSHSACCQPTRYSPHVLSSNGYAAAGPARGQRQLLQTQPRP